MRASINCGGEVLSPAFFAVAMLSSIAGSERIDGELRCPAQRGATFRVDRRGNIAARPQPAGVTSQVLNPQLVRDEFGRPPPNSRSNRSDTRHFR
jgi:hypothetical protein